MSTANSDETQPCRKWLRCDPETPARDVARLALSSRLEQVPILLELSFRHGAEDPDHIRQLRVATRRATTALHLFGRFISPAIMSHIARDLKKIRKAAGRVRDLDVLIANVRGRNPESKALPGLETRRTASEVKIAKSYQKYVASGRFSDSIRQMLESTTLDVDEAADKPFDNWARGTMHASTESFFANWPVGYSYEDDPFLELHNFRLEVKRIRYRMELLGISLPKKKRKKFNRKLKQLQSSLGVVNDHDVAIQKTHRWMRKADPEKKEHLKRQLENELIARTAAVRVFQTEWPAESRDKLQAKFTKMMKPRIPDAPAESFAE